MQASSQESKQDDSSLSVLLLEALQNYRAGNTQKVELILNNILRDNPNCLEALKLLGMLSHTNN